MIQVGPFTLDDFQEQAVINTRQAVANGSDRVLLVSPTGSGKTIMAAAIIQSTVEKGNRIAFITSGRQLIFQMVRTLEDMGIQHTVMMSNSGYEYSPGAQVAVISKDTLASRIKNGVPWTPPDVFIVDEADVCLSQEWRSILESN